MPAFELLSVFNDLLGCLLEAATWEDFRQRLLTIVARLFPASSRLAWVHQIDGHWTIRGPQGLLERVPSGLIATAADRLEPVEQDGTLAIPIEVPESGVELLLISPADGTAREIGVALLPALRLLWELFKRRCESEQRAGELETLVDLAAKWQVSRDPKQLLHDIASAAAKALHGDRASIFLWDKRQRELVGYPALGVEGESLRIRDDQGIAGSVLRTGTSYRWHAAEDPALINAEVGQRLGYVTRSLIAVPLRDRRGKIIGVFEVLNHRSGRFSVTDERFLTELARHAAAAVENIRDIAELTAAREHLLQSVAHSVRLIGHCAPIEALRQSIDRIAPTELAVLILGENGTGKEVVARSIHLLSDRRDRPFVAVNCAAIPETLLESELFGHEKGAFTDASTQHPGKFEIASGGTLLLDEIGEMSLSGQAKLLRVLEEKTLVRVGGTRPIRVDVRIVAATNQDLVQLVRQRKFRQDLYFRLTVVTLNVPALRERGEDVIVLAEYFLEQFAHQIGRRPPRLSESAKARLRNHRWPGNVRELRNMMERVSYLSRSDTIDAADLEFVLSPTDVSSESLLTDDLTLTEATMEFQRQFIRRHIESAGGNLARAAQAMGMHRSNLYRKMNQLGMKPQEELGE
ncbi:MAG: sigma-54-dependent Fis family transcriptional regulator [Pirellulaceae bacterium]|nr:MAG: sigma-54-dependent Fis family transcriptional regulator [Pirellulaceae bacterium]